MTIMLMIAFPGLVVIAQDTAAIDNECESILVAVPASGKRRWQTPDHHFHECIFSDNMTLIEH